MPLNCTVAVIGLGYVGSCIAATLATRGAQVSGIDVDPGLVSDLARGESRSHEPGLRETLAEALAAGRLEVTTDISVAAAADVVVIAVGTPVRDDGSLVDDQLRAACLALAPQMRAGQLVLLKSTVPAGTTRSLVRPLLESGGRTAGVDFSLAFTPERLAEGTALADLATLPIVVGGLDEASTRAAADFWRQALDVAVLPQDCLEAAEIVKLADNWWIDLNIALANELAKFCALYQVDVLDVISAANSIPKGNGSVNILMPSVGVGGSCLTKDPWMVWMSARQHGLDIRTAPAGRHVNDGMPEYTAGIVIDELTAAGRAPETATVAVLGLAFKNDTGDLRATPVRGVVTALAKAGAQVRLYDPLVDGAQAERVFGIRPTPALDEAVRDADCVAVLAFHREFADIDFATLPVARPCLLLDGRAYYPKETIDMLRVQGYRYRGIGR
ncbi:nucleotide sugar dehydrogenase [Solwaraspora sp. WMMA2056]|uniref:nucleotide sugar dehydrogenase n=1 Tax=Solwaraspora sp. WMMA2056 TaxID=3015161 RepID=UPI00259B4474|nr:nucleotide sugar dehydrogenase [Solwaraspora sp. WMMA2056]WJK42597.1 nucleotide sugar dehydrogenase [Solwaraspora sp. WMMA2056]